MRVEDARQDRIEKGDHVLFPLEDRLRIGEIKSFSEVGMVNLQTLADSRSHTRWCRDLILHTAHESR